MRTYPCRFANYLAYILLIIWHTPACDELSAIPRASREIALQCLELLRHLFTQMQRVFANNGLEVLSVDVIENARENLVIGQA